MSTDRDAIRLAIQKALTAKQAPQKSSVSGPSIPRQQRIRKKIEITLSDEARERLERVAAATGESRSMLIERLIMAVYA